MLLPQRPLHAQDLPVESYISGFQLVESKAQCIRLTYHTPEFRLDSLLIDGEWMLSLQLPGVFLPGEAGRPNLPTESRYVALPKGVQVMLSVDEGIPDTLFCPQLLPAPRIPKETDDGLEYFKDPLAYQTDAFSPAQVAKVSGQASIRGTDVVLVGVTPFRYNPVSGELLVYRSLTLTLEWQGGSGTIGDPRLGSRWWQPILDQVVLNAGDLPAPSTSYKSGGGNGSKTPDYEYLIICPNDASFLAWADSLKQFRTMQGIRTGVVTTTDLGGNDPALIEQYLNAAYTTWAVPPVAVLLLGDHGSSGSTVAAPVYDNYCVSDNLYADVDGDHLPDMVVARITAQNAGQLATMVGRVLDYERHPPLQADFYAHPITAMGWQTERWFQLCSESVHGFLSGMGKSPVRENAVYSGTPGGAWSSAINTSTVVNYFGPSGLGYIPSTTAHLTDWGGNATRLNADMNSGAFMLLHRDHGYTSGWGEPAYSTSSLPGLSGNLPTFVFSLNCLTGKYNLSGSSFAESFHRMSNGCLGMIAASEVSYSFVNDVFTWGLMDQMWPQFMPSFGLAAPERLFPAFGNAAGKYFLQQSSWPYNSGNKEVTYHLFHHHGDAFSTMYSQVPQAISVTHDAILPAGAPGFAITAELHSFIALCVGGQLIATAEATGGPQNLALPTLYAGDTLIVTVTLQDHFRYSARVVVIPPNGAYVIAGGVSVNDGPSGNGSADYGETFFLDLTLQNLGNAFSSNLSASLRTADPLVTLLDTLVSASPQGAISDTTLTTAFRLKLSPLAENGRQVPLQVGVVDGNQTLTRTFLLNVAAPVLGSGEAWISDTGTPANGRLDPAEGALVTFPIHNTGMATASGLSVSLTGNDPYVSASAWSVQPALLPSGATALCSFQVLASPQTPPGHQVQFVLNFIGDSSLSLQVPVTFRVGQVPVGIVDLDPNHNSAPAMAGALNSIGVSFHSLSAFPTDPGLYTALFVCLGVYNNNHVLSQAEGQALSAYLQSGGRLYLEGGDTWFYDDPTPVHSYFSLQAVADGSGDLGMLSGSAGTFTHGMQFSYSGDNNWIDRLQPTGSAFGIFTNDSPVYTCAVAYDGGGYRSVGSSFEFGGLTDGAVPSTRLKLMEALLQFFSLAPQPLLPVASASASSVCAGHAVTFYDQSQGTIQSRTWSFPGGNPSTSTQPNPIITYTQPGSYDVILTVSDGTNSQQICLLQMITVEAPPVITVPPFLSICEGEAANLSPVSAQGHSSLFWTCSGDGQFSDSLTLNPSYQPGPLDVSRGFVHLYFHCQGYGPCNDTIGHVYLNIHALPVPWTVTGGGTPCSSPHPLPVGLSGSSPGDLYLLLRDGLSTGMVRVGYGQPITFGNQIQAGTYSVQAWGASGGCQAMMQGAVALAFRSPVKPQLGPDLTLGAQGPLALNAGTGYAAYQWNTGDTSAVLCVGVPGTYHVTVSSVQGCQGSDTVMVSSPLSFVQGRVRYLNAQASGIEGAEIIMKSASGLALDTAYSAGDGAYSMFTHLGGPVTVGVQPNLPWKGGCINATDAMLIMKHFIQADTLSGLALLAADVDNSRYINTSDAMLVQKRYVGMISAFPAGSWVFGNAAVSLAPAMVMQADLEALQYGDVNGSYLPSKDEQDYLAIGRPMDGEAWIGNGIPFFSNEKGQVQAFSLALELPEDVIIKGARVPGHPDAIIFRQEGRILRMAWASIQPAPAGPLFVLETDGPCPALPASLRLLDAELAPGAGEDPGLSYRMPEGVAAHCSAFPNPFREGVTLTPWLPEAGSGRLEILRSDGAVIHTRELSLPEGGTPLLLPRSLFPSAGWYAYRLILPGTTLSGSLICR